MPARKKKESCKESCYAKLSVCNLAMALGLVWGLGMFATAWLSIWFGLGGPIIKVLGSVYVGFEPSFVGSLWGLLWGFIDGFVGGALIALFYNCFRCCCCCPYCKKSRK